MQKRTDLKQKEQDSLKNGEFITIDRGWGAFNHTPPKARFNHIAFIYKNKLFIHGGTTIPSTDFSDDPLDLFFYHLQQKSWQKIKTKCSNKQAITVLNSHTSALVGNKLFVFGGSNASSKCNNILWRLNLDSYEWIKLQQKGQVPSARQSAHLIAYDKNWLLLYGGLNVNQAQIYNSFHLFNVETKTWIKSEGSFQYLIYARLQPALCLQKNKVYLFGGLYRNSLNQQKYFDDFYQIDVTLPSKTTLPRINIKRIVTSITPSARSGHSLSPIGTNFIVLIGGQNSRQNHQANKLDVSPMNDIWVFNIEKVVWAKLIVSGVLFKSRTLAAIVDNKDSVYICGGLMSYSQVLSDIVELKINADELQSHQFKIRKVQCKMCTERALNQIYQPQPFSAVVVDQIVEQIEFPFAAIGLLIDNAFLAAATKLNIYMKEDLSKTNSSLKRHLKFQDNGKLFFSEEEFIGMMVHFQASINTTNSGIDKKTKVALGKDIMRRQYGSNLKIGSLRLGETFLFISVTPNGEEIRVSLFVRQGKGTQNERYALYYYSYFTQTNELINKEHAACKAYILQEYRQYVAEAVTKKTIIKNSLYIFGLKVYQSYNSQDYQFQLKPNVIMNQIIYGRSDLISQLDKNGYSIYESVDVSLKSYISSLYLKNDTLSILLSVKNKQLEQIPHQMHLQKLDKLCKLKQAQQLQVMSQFQFKIVEMYYLNDLKMKTNYFINGLLLYHKNRLICRYQYKLGQLLERRAYDLQGNFNFLKLFGYVQLNQNVPVNMFKTDFIFNIMLERMYSRMKFISSYLEEKGGKQKEVGTKRLPPKPAPDDDFSVHRDQDSSKKKNSKNQIRAENEQENSRPIQ